MSPERRRRRSLRGDLDTIVLKALKKKPDERYPTVHALVRGHRTLSGGRPVLARRTVSGTECASSSHATRSRSVRPRQCSRQSSIGASVATWQARVALAEKDAGGGSQGVHRLGVSRGRSDTGPRKESCRRGAAAPGRSAGCTIAPMSSRHAVELLAIIGESLFGLQENTDAARVARAGAAAAGVRTAVDDAARGATASGVVASLRDLGKNDDARRELDRSFAALAASGGRRARCSCRQNCSRPHWASCPPTTRSPRGRPARRSAPPPRRLARRHRRWPPAFSI